MPLLDHFYPPLSRSLQWNSFHHSWAASIAYELNDRLPRGFAARPHCVFGIEIDAAALQDRTIDPEPVRSWAAPPATRTVPFAIGADEIEVLVYEQSGDMLLAGAIELVSPRNKDRTTAKDAFVGKCLAYLNQGVGVVVIDVVTERKGSLHNELLSRIAPTEPPFLAELYAVAYRPTSGKGTSAAGTKVRGEGFVELWPESLELGRVLPTLPLWLLNGPCMRLDLEATYLSTLQHLRVRQSGTNGQHV